MHRKIFRLFKKAYTQEVPRPTEEFYIDTELSLGRRRADPGTREEGPFARYRPDDIDEHGKRTKKRWTPELTEVTNTKKEFLPYKEYGTTGWVGWLSSQSPTQMYDDLDTGANPGLPTYSGKLSPEFIKATSEEEISQQDPKLVKFLTTLKEQIPEDVYFKKQEFLKELGVIEDSIREKTGELRRLSEDIYEAYVSLGVFSALKKIEVSDLPSEDLVKLIELVHELRELNQNKLNFLEKNIAYLDKSEKLKYNF